MVEIPGIGKDSVAVLLKGGRLPSWHALTADEQRAFSEEHVELMLSVAREHGMMRLEGFKLLSPLQDWARFWVIEFPDLAGAEAWIDAEMAPPYGLYGHFEYHVSRRWKKDEFDGWVANPLSPVVVPAGTRPVLSTDLGVDEESVVVLLFGRWLPGAEAETPEERGDREHIDLMQSVAREHGLMRLEAYRLIGPQPDWHRAWVIEFPDLEGAEAWIEAELRPPHGRFATKTYHLARKWAPEYFATWVPR
jgi:hypothetical protein